jgi:predicted DNA-binding transcriptional regulator AlpA
MDEWSRYRQHLRAQQDREYEEGKRMDEDHLRVVLKRDDVRSKVLTGQLTRKELEDFEVRWREEDAAWAAQRQRRIEDQKRRYEEGERELKRLEQLVDHPLWEQTKPPVAPEEEQLLTMNEVVALFGERLKVSRATFYRQYRKHLTVYYLGSSGRPSRFGRKGWSLMRAKKSDVEALINDVVRAPIGKTLGRERYDALR